MEGSTTSLASHSKGVGFRRPGMQKLRLPTATSSFSVLYTEPSPCTPCSVFSFELPSTPMVRLVRREESSGSRSLKSPRSAFSFDPSSLPTTPLIGALTPKTPRTPKTPKFTELPTIEEARTSFSFPASCEQPSTPLAEPPTDWKSIRLMALNIFLTRIQFTVYFASLWPFLQEVEPNATTHDFALINAGYSIGIAASAPLFGYWSTKVGCIRIPSMFSMFLMILSNLMYLFLYFSPVSPKYIMAVARFIAGVAAGGNSLLPTYWTYAARAEDRSTAAALFDGVFSLGLAFGPGVQLLCAMIGKGFYVGSIPINTYTCPALLACICVVASFINSAFVFEEVPMQAAPAKSEKDECSSLKIPPCDKIAVAVCIIIKMCQMFVYANMETIGSIYTQRMFKLDHPETIIFNSQLVSASGIMGFVFLIGYVYTKIGRRIDNRRGVLISIFICISFLIVTFSWHFYDSTIADEGCKEPWCETTTRIPKWLYAVAYIIVFGVGFAMLNVHLAAMYSQVLGPRRQGVMHGINTLLASCSRVVGPILISDVFTYQGPRLVWNIQLIVWVLTLMLIIFTWKRLVKPTF